MEQPNATNPANRRRRRREITLPTELDFIARNAQSLHQDVVQSDNVGVLRVSRNGVEIGDVLLRNRDIPESVHTENALRRVAERFTSPGAETGRTLSTSQAQNYLLSLVEAQRDALYNREHDLRRRESGRQRITPVRRRDYRPMQDYDPRQNPFNDDDEEADTDSEAKAVDLNFSDPMRDTLFSTRRLETELDELSRRPVEGIYASPVDDDYFKWYMVIEGPVGTPWEGGVFHGEIKLHVEYPFTPFCHDSVTMRTRIFHWNVNPAGSINVKPLLDDWRPTLTLRDVLEYIRDMFFIKKDDSYDGVSNKKIAELVKENREEFEEKARVWTKRYAD